MDTWNTIRLAYVRGYVDRNGQHKYYNQHELARKYGVSRQAIADRAAKEKWLDEREQVRQHIYNLARSEYERKEAANLAYLDTLASQCAVMAVEHMLVTMQAASSDEMDTLVIRYSRAVPFWQKVGRTALGAPSESVQIQPHEVDYDRLAEAYGISSLSDGELKARCEQLSKDGAA